MNQERRRVCLDDADITISGISGVNRIRITGTSPKDTTEVWNVLVEGCLRE